jgi:hypothetical protein
VFERQGWAAAAKRFAVGVRCRHHGHSGSESKLFGCSPSASVLRYLWP